MRLNKLPKVTQTGSGKARTKIEADPEATNARNCQLHWKALISALHSIGEEVSGHREQVLSCQSGPKIRLEFGAHLPGDCLILALFRF